MKKPLENVFGCHRIVLYTESIDNDKFIERIIIFGNVNVLFQLFRLSDINIDLGIKRLDFFFVQCKRKN